MSTSIQDSVNSTDTGPIIAGPYITPDSETWPLTAKRFRSWGWCWDVEGSLRTVMLFLFGSAAAVTIALLAQLHAGSDGAITAGGSIVTDHPICTQIGLSALKNGGNAVDAAVAAVFCLGVVHFHVTGIGGGGVLLAYNERAREVVDVLNFEVSPSVVGSPVGVGVPGLVAGLWTAHQRHGRLPWTSLLSPSIQLARSGFPVSVSLAKAASCVAPTALNPTLYSFLQSVKHGSNISIPKLANTLQLIADQGPKEIYNGSIAEEMVYTVKVANGSLQRSDLASYQVTLAASEKTRFDDFDIIVPASSFPGTFLLDSLDAIQTLDLLPEESLTGDTIRKLSDILYDTQNTLITKEGGTKMAAKHGTVVTVTDSMHNLVSVVTGLNSLFGSELMTEVGFMLNDFVTNGTVSSVGTPVIALQQAHICGTRIITGGGDVSALVQVLTQLITFAKRTNESVEAPRFHLGALPRSILLEGDHVPTLSTAALTSLQTMQVSVEDVAVSSGCAWYDPINVITLQGDSVRPYADSRGDGQAALAR